MKKRIWILLAALTICGYAAGQVTEGFDGSIGFGKFMIGVGASVAPIPFQKRHHSESRYK